MSDFSLHTLGVIYVREQKFSEFLTFVNEDIIASGIHVLALAPDDFSKITDAAGRFHLDFDDAYQYAVAERYDLSIVSFDKDFDRKKERKSDAGGTVPKSSVIRRFFVFSTRFKDMPMCNRPRLVQQPAARTGSHARLFCKFPHIFRVPDGRCDAKKQIIFFVEKLYSLTREMRLS